MKTSWLLLLLNSWADKVYLRPVLWLFVAGKRGKMVEFQSFCECNTVYRRSIKTKSIYPHPSCPSHVFANWYWKLQLFLLHHTFFFHSTFSNILGNSPIKLFSWLILCFPVLVKVLSFTAKYVVFYCSKKKYRYTKWITLIEVIHLAKII